MKEEKEKKKGKVFEEDDGGIGFLFLSSKTTSHEVTSGADHALCSVL